MATRKHLYLCDRCSSTKTIVENTERTGNQRIEVPSYLPCGWRGCEGTQFKHESLDVNPFDPHDGAAILAEAKRRYHTDAEFKAIVEYSFMFALADGTLPLPMKPQDFTELKERVRMAAAVALVMRDNKETNGAGT